MGGVVPLLEVAIGTGRGGQRLRRQHPVAALGLVDLHHLGIEARPAGDLQVVADQPVVQPVRRHLAQMVQRRGVAAGPGLDDQLVIGHIGERQARP